MVGPSRDETLGALSLLDEPVRRRLYDWVASQTRPVGRAGAAKALGISHALAAFHPDKLVEAGLLEASYQRLTGRVGPGAGRPARVYRRAARELAFSVPERRYERAAHLFATALENVADPPVPGPLRIAAQGLGEDLGKSAGPRSGRRRLLAALEAGGYEPHVEDGGEIRLRNCPFHALAQEHRALVCGTNLELAEGMVRGAGVPDRPVLDPQPGFCCVAFMPPPAISERTKGQ